MEPAKVDKSPSRRQVILDAALALFAERGVEGTSMKMLAGRAGISAGLTYHYFSSKAQLLDEVIESRALSFPDLTSRHQDSINDVIPDFVEKFGENLQINLDIVWLFYREYRSSKTVAERVDRRRDGWVKALAGYIEARQVAGEVRKLSPVVASRSLLGSLFHLHLSEKPTEDYVREMVDIFLAGIRK